MYMYGPFIYGNEVLYGMGSVLSLSHMLLHNAPSLPNNTFVASLPQPYNLVAMGTVAK